MILLNLQFLYSQKNIKKYKKYKKILYTYIYYIFYIYFTYNIYKFMFFFIVINYSVNNFTSKSRIKFSETIKSK